ncbi:MAG: methylated-DNA--[protein]-cysteine S-methyltransferase [Flavobacteriaceae bacterium]|jgi:methylated-DNA-[protein]-cysteine S-methyltransferase|nr:methylated-DNA--[protein]-cysteine S-methyltransferase [Flavobacteriaceae bacterium]
MDALDIQYHQTPVGELVLGSFGNRLCLCDWKFRKNRAPIDKRIKNCLHVEFVEENSETLTLATHQLDEYFERKREKFTVPLLFCGTDFQKWVWNELLKIPYGKTLSYLELSKNVNNTKAVRAVASANGANALSLFVPCHRVVGSDNKLVGYAGGLQAKKKLLELEKNELQQELF